MLHITDAHYISGYRFWVAFDNGSQGQIDLKDSLKGPIFAPLNDIELFRLAKLDPELETLVWPNGADFAPEFLYSLLNTRRPDSAISQ